METSRRTADLTLADPWATTSAPAPAPTRAPVGWAWLAAWVLGVAGPAARVAPNGWNGQRGAVALVLFGLLFAACLRSRRSPWVRFGAALVTVAALGVAAVPFIGRAPVVITVAAVFVAHAALVRWEPWPGHPTRRTAQASLAIPVLAAAGVHWYRSGSNRTVAVALVAGLVVVELYSLLPGLFAAIDRPVERVVRALGRGVAESILFLVVVPVVFVPGAVVEALGRRHRRRHHRSSSWVITTMGVDRQRRDAAHPFGSTEPGIARRRLAAGALVAAALAGSTYVVARPDPAPVVAPVRQPRQASDPPIIFGREFDADYSDLPAYRGVAWADDLQEEQANTPVADQYDGELVHVAEGRRVSTLPSGCQGCPKATVWLTGGSSVWGVGQRDGGTIASQLVTQAEQEGVALTVDNMGIRGSTIDGQIDAIEARLETDDAPDLIVFNNGFNETGVELANQLVAGGNADDRSLVSGDLQDLDVTHHFEDLEAANERIEQYLEWDLGPSVATATAATYRREQDRMSALADEHDVAVRYFFQPDALASRHQVDSYEAISGIPTDALLESPLPLALERIPVLLGDRVIDLRHLFDDEEQVVFLGLVHQNERGAELVAEAMLPTLLDSLPA